MSSTMDVEIQACLMFESKHTWQDNLYVFAMNITERIELLLEARGVKPRARRRALAEACDISYQAVSQWFSGETGNIRNDNLTAIAQKYGSSVDWLLTGKGPMLQPDKGEVDESGKDKGKVNAAATSAVHSLMNKATPRSRRLLERIETLALQGRLTEDDLALLDGIIDRFDKN